MENKNVYILLLLLTFFAQKKCYAQKDIFGINNHEVALVKVLELGSGTLFSSAIYMIQKYPDANDINFAVDSNIVAKLKLKKDKIKSLSIWYNSTIVLSIKMKNRKLLVYENISENREFVINFNEYFEIMSIVGNQNNQRCHLDFLNKTIKCKKRGVTQSENSISEAQRLYFETLFNKYYLGKFK